MADVKPSTGWVFWLEAGAGVRWLTRAAVVLGVLVLSFVVAMKQFNGPRSEETLRQAAVARQLAEGRGFTTPVNEPHLVAWFESQGRFFDAAVPYPELRHPPLYPALLGAVLAAIPEGVRVRWLGELPVPPDGFGGDYLLLAVNLALLWLAAWLTWRLGVRLFSSAVGAGAAFALLLSAPLWRATVAVDGTPLAMVLFLVVLLAWARAGAAGQTDGSGLGWWAVAGVACGALFLTDYPAGVLAPVVAGAAGWGRPSGRRLVPVIVVLGAALLVAAPWLGRNLAISGHPLGLAWEDVALRAGDPTAEPEDFRRTFSPDVPGIALRKLANKALTAVQDGVQGGLWAGGLFFAAFFAAGWLYRFQHDTVRTMRAGGTLAIILLIVSQGLFNSGEGERLPALWVAPFTIVFGAGFFQVLLGSHAAWAARPQAAWVGVLALQALPLWQDVLEPRRAHFSYPPYHPGIFVELGAALRRGEEVGWMADVPAGAAWYSGRRVWAQPATLRDFHRISVMQEIDACVFTPHTLDRPFFSILNRPTIEASRFGDWGKVYLGLVQDRLPPDFPLTRQEKLADNFRVLSAPGALRPAVK